MTPAPPTALYVHVPFCLSVCPYCDFVVYGGAAARGPRNLVAEFVDALATELELRAVAASESVRGHRPVLRSVYFGGGTPSLLTAQQIGRLLAVIDDGFGIAPGAEVTLEANPGVADRGDVGGFRAAGVTRLSIGAQSMIPGELRSIGRRHAPDDVAATVALARRARMESVSVDLLYDLPDQTLDSWRRTLDAVLALEPDHVSAYALALDDPEAEGLTGSLGDHLPLSSGARRWRERARGGQDEDRAAACYREADERLAIAGLRWYELSNWGRPGHESRHNLCYWRRLAHEAVGPGAHAFDGALTRRWNGARIDRYLAALGPPGATARQLPPGASETVDVTTAVAERAILGLRLRHGLDPATADEPALRDALRWGESSGLLKRMADGSLRLTDRGRLLANELFVRLLPEVRVAAA